MNLTKIDIKDWRQKLSVLFQQFESYIFSVREAIGYGDVKRLGDLSGIKDAAKQTGVDEFIEGLPLKYKNPLSPRFDKGVKPSIGQLQRIGISRMLFRKGAKALILDEPTSNVDPEAEEKIFKMLVKKTKNKVLIFVTQRFSTVRIADRIFVVDKGKIIEDGTHKELMAKDGKYAKLFTLQAQAYLS
jgi:ATP-binding cassette subfamily B protein